MNRAEPVSALIPTIGRVALLSECLRSLAKCDPPAAEIIVVDQSRDHAVSSLAAAYESRGVRVIGCDQRGISTGVNLGLRHAANEVVLITHDDCLVAPSWVGAGREALERYPEHVVTGRVLPHGDPNRVPSTRDEQLPRELARIEDFRALYPSNMAVRRSVVLGFGAFDERFRAPAEDLDFGYRWLRAGRRLRYEPSMLVWHVDWRSDEQLERVYREYWRGLAFFYAKHLRRRDLLVLRFLGGDLWAALRSGVARAVKGRPYSPDARAGFARGFPGGFVEGWRTYGGAPPT